MYDCVTGTQIEGSHGCIMADEMVSSINIHTLAVLVLYTCSATYISVWILVGAFVLKRFGYIFHVKIT